MEHAGKDKENIGRRKNNAESTYKKNIHPHNTRYSTGAIQKTNQQPTYGNLRSSRPPLADRLALCDLKQTQNPQTYYKTHVRFDDFMKPALIGNKSKCVRNSTFIKERPKPNVSKILHPNSTYVSVDSTWYQSFSDSSTLENFAVSSDTDDSTFWSSFLTISNITIDPHKKVLKFEPVREVNESKLQSTDSIIHDFIPSMRRKTLKKQISKTSGYLGVVNLDPITNYVDPVILYSLEYMNDVIFNIIKKQEPNILKPELLDNTDSIFPDQRACVINWLVKLHQYLVSDAGVFFTSVRLFDKILALVAIPESNYQLTAMAAYWISVKYNNSTNFVTAQKLMRLCNNVFTAKCLFEMEKTIFLILHFDVVVDDPIIFVYYYIYMLQLLDSNIIGFCANYLLELLTLDFNCNTFSLTLQAASAVFLSLKFFNVNEKVWQNTEKYFGYHEKREMFEVQKIMIKNIILTTDEECSYKESYQKYSTEKYGKVSLIIPQILAKWYNVNDILN